MDAYEPLNVEEYLSSGVDLDTAFHAVEMAPGVFSRLREMGWEDIFVVKRKQTTSGLQAGEMAYKFDKEGRINIDVGISSGRVALSGS